MSISQNSSTSISHASFCPQCAAACSGVHPSKSCEFKFAPPCRRTLQTKQQTYIKIWSCYTSPIRYSSSSVLPSNCMQQSPVWEVNTSSDSQDIPSILWNTEVNYCVHKCPLLAPFLNQMNPVHTLISCLRYILILFSHLRISFCNMVTFMIGSC